MPFRQGNIFIVNTTYRQTMSAAECAERIRSSERVAALTGAGISTAAGIPDFRGPNGLYVTRRYDPDTVFDIHAFRRNPLPFYDFTRDFLEFSAPPSQP